MKIGFNAKKAFFNTSGLGNYSRNTLNALQKYFPDNQYSLFTPGVKIGMLQNHDDFDFVTPPKTMSNFKKKRWLNSEVSKELKNHNLDLFHGLSNELPWGIHKTTIPTIVTIHDLVFIRYPEFYKYFERIIYRRRMKYACKTATKIIAISEQTKSDIINFIGADSQKIEIIHQSISPLFFESADTKKVKEKYKLPDQFILAVGTIEERKNQLSILKALQANKMDIPLVLVGEPTSYTNDIHKYIAAGNIKSPVIFLKNIPEKDLAAIYQLASLSIYISVFEGFGLPVIEAMACGCPVITSNASCLPETAGNAAILCPPNNIDSLGNHIFSLLNDSETRDSLIAKGKIRAEEFRAKKYVKKLTDLYTSILT